MLNFLVYSLIAAAIVSLISILVVVSLFWSKRFENGYLLYLLSLSAGGMIGAGLFHLLPEAVEMFPESLLPYVLTVTGFCLFFLVEKIVHWHHSYRHDRSENERLGYINLFGDALHNFLDGIAIVSSFAVSPSLGTAVSLAVIFHEIPQEIGDFGVLLYAGFSRAKALFYNFLVALLAMLGVFVGYLLLRWNLNLEAYLIPVAAGSFLYIAATDLVPEIHKEEKLPQSLLAFLILLAGVVAMYLIKVYFE